MVGGKHQTEKATEVVLQLRSGPVPGPTQPRSANHKPGRWSQRRPFSKAKEGSAVSQVAPSKALCAGQPLKIDGQCFFTLPRRRVTLCPSSLLCWARTQRLRPTGHWNPLSAWRLCLQLARTLCDGLHAWMDAGTFEGLDSWPRPNSRCASGNMSSVRERMKSCALSGARPETPASCRHHI